MIMGRCGTRRRALMAARVHLHRLQALARSTEKADEMAALQAQWRISS